MNQEERIQIEVYTHEEIKKILDVADLTNEIYYFVNGFNRYDALVQLLDLKLKHLQEISDKERIYKITVYEKSKEEYYTFCSHECYSIIKSYLDYRKNNGEILDKESFLIREQFDINDFEQIRKKSRGISLYAH